MKCAILVLSAIRQHLAHPAKAKNQIKTLTLGNIYFDLILEPECIEKFIQKHSPVKLGMIT